MRDHIIMGVAIINHVGRHSQFPNSCAEVMGIRVFQNLNKLLDIGLVDLNLQKLLEGSELLLYALVELLAAQAYKEILKLTGAARADVFPKQFPHRNFWIISQLPDCLSNL